MHLGAGESGHLKLQIQDSEVWGWIVPVPPSPPSPFTTPPSTHTHTDSQAALEQLWAGQDGLITWRAWKGRTA